MLTVLIKAVAVRNSFMCGNFRNFIRINPCFVMA
jgi:hypothetical protein